MFGLANHLYCSKDHGFGYHRVFRETALQVQVFETLGAPLVEVRTSKLALLRPRTAE